MTTAPAAIVCRDSNCAYFAFASVPIQRSFRMKIGPKIAAHYLALRIFRPCKQVSTTVFPVWTSVLPRASIANARAPLPHIEPATQKLRANSNARPTIRKETRAGVHELLTVGHEPTGIFGTRTHSLAKPFLVRRQRIRNRMRLGQLFG